MEHQSDDRRQDMMEGTAVNSGQGRDVAGDDDDDDDEEPFFHHDGYVPHSRVFCQHRCFTALFKTCWVPTVCTVVLWFVVHAIRARVDLCPA